MARLKIIQIQCLTQEAIKKITNDARTAVSKICLGIDDMQLLGNKALVIRAEIYPKKISLLYSSLEAIGVKVNEQNLPDLRTK